MDAGATVTAPRGRITLSKLKHRGWTPAMVRDLLGEPDAKAENPRYPAMAPMRLYERSRVERVESSPDYHRMKEAAARLSAAARASADRRRQELIDEVRSVEVTLEAMPLRRLQEEAIDHFNARNRGRRGFRPVNDTAERSFLQRIAVNYARHCLTSYDGRLEALFARVGKDQAIQAIRVATYAAIARTWPELAGECGQQRARRTRNWEAAVARREGRSSRHRADALPASHQATM